MYSIYGSFIHTYFWVLIHIIIYTRTSISCDRLSEMRAGCSELQGRLVKLESERKKQDLWLKER